MHVGNQITVDLDSVRLKLGQQLQTGESRAKVIDATLIPALLSCLTALVNSSKREIASLSVNSTTICSGTKPFASIAVSKNRRRQEH